MDTNTQKKKLPDRPFYLPQGETTSSRIITEAKESLGNRTGLQAVVTKRPCTPRDATRSLFGASSSRTPENRPPSSFSLGSRHFDGSDTSRPASRGRLQPINHKPKIPTEEEIDSGLLPPKPPSDPNKVQRGKATRTRLQQSTSVESSLSSEVKSGLETSPSDGNQVIKNADESVRRVHSGPKERTPIPVEERGEGDGREMPHRAPSSASVRSPPRSAESRTGSGGTKRTSSAGSTGRGGSAGRREEETAEEALFFSQNITPLLDRMTDASSKKDAKRLGQVTEELYSLLQKENLLGRSCKQRTTILKSIFKLLDVEDSRIQLKLARLILALKVTGTNLLSACKLVFKISRNEKNDPEFLKGDILDVLMDTLKSTDPFNASEALVFCIGSLKLLTGNSTIVKQLVKKDCIESLAILLNSINKTIREGSEPTTQIGNILIQATAALRNLADAGSSRERLLGCQAIESLCLIIDSFTSDGDLMLNISRIFSKVTLHTDCCTALADYPTSYKSFVSVLQKHQHKSDVVVRVSFVLGNMTAKNEVARLRLFQEAGSFDILLALFRFYLEQDVKNQGKEVKKEVTEDGSTVNKTEDVLIKVIRVIANLSINENVGPVICSNYQCVDYLLKVLETKDVSSSEELVLNTVATINNLSFYNTKTSAITTHQVRVLEALLKLVLANNMEAMVEACRVFANLTRQRVVRDFLTEQKIDRMLVTMLDSGNREVVYISCGVLINFMVDEEKRPMLKQEHGIRKLVEVLRDFSKTDWELASLVCQILWNYSGKITSSNDCFGQQESQDLMELLMELLDRDSALDLSFKEDEEMTDYFEETWTEQFCPVAEQLLQRIETHQSDLEPLENPSGS
ncbi:armadillo repeat-containing protein 2-like isoform X2 [Saccostrea echinata]|uniref:armadillo repeat-containing protein 2-like isoform X2 n=1 Tax=Saccostrea echinata TaxID=191078 RepID=UPI002A835F75|nr:armadillo repeat-containing protein 2-like isoform X2 [Saccostrea echinata]